MRRFEERQVAGTACQMCPLPAEAAGHRRRTALSEFRRVPAPFNASRKRFFATISWAREDMSHHGLEVLQR